MASEPEAFETPYGRLPRDPAEFRPTRHFAQRRRERDVPPEAIRECIEDGEAKHSQTSGVYFLEVEHVDERFRLVVGWSHTDGWQARTVYRPGGDEDA